MNTYETSPLPHPFPYQGSKRGIAKYILPYFPQDVDRLIEPFCGAGAVSIAASAYGLSERILLNDINKPLMKLWAEILQRPDQLAARYEELWIRQQTDRKKFFFEIRDQFNKTHQPHHLLYLLARIVKGAIRYSSEGAFNQSADNRRSGMRPVTMRKNILGVSKLLTHKNRASIESMDFKEVTDGANRQDLIYMDPPYQGTSFTRDHRYYDGLTYASFVDALSAMNARGISYIVSYDGTTGSKTHGKRLPEFLRLEHLHICAGRSSQATLLGASQETMESLYLSPALVERLQEGKLEATHRAANERQELPECVKGVLRNHFEKGR